VRLMRRFLSWRVPLRSLLRRDRVEREMDAELRFHFEQLVAEHVAAGMSVEAARRNAGLEFGGVEVLKEDCRDVTAWRWIESLGQDVRYGARNLRKSPGLVAVSVLSLGLGIGLNIALYSAARTVFGNRPTMAEPESVFGIELGDSRQLSYPNLRDIQESSIFSSVMGFRATSMTVRKGDDRQRIGVIVVTGNFFEGLGIPTERGRPFTAQEVATSQPSLVVVSHDYWTRRLGASPQVLGEVLNIDGRPFTIVGVLPATHRAITGFIGPDAYVSLNRDTLPALDDRGTAALTALGRLRPGTTSAQAQAEVSALGQTLARSFPEQNEALNRPARLRPAAWLQFGIGLEIVTVLLFLLFAVVLLIGCANVAGMLLARAVSRRHELSIRAALGAGRRRIVQALLVESLLLALLGSAAGFALALSLSSIRLPGRMTPALQYMIEPDLGLLLVCFALAIVTALLCGVAPAIAASRPAVLTGRQYGGEHATTRGGLRNVFVIGQLALSVVLLVIAALCLRAQLQILSVDLGFDLHGGVVAMFDLEPNRYPAAARLSLADAVVERLEQLPGIESAGVASLVPLGGESLVHSFHPAGRSDIPGTRPWVYSVGPRYFRTMGISLIDGREFLPTDNDERPAAVIVNETFARTYFPGQNALGRRVQTGSEADAELVGVVSDSRIDTIGEAPKSVLYYAWAQRPRRLVVHARTASPAAAITAVQRAIGEVDALADVTVTTRSEAASLELTMRRTGTLIVGAIGVVGLMLTVIGLYGVVAYMVASRTVEIGIRMALGATPGRLRGEVLWYAVRLAAVGVALGTGATVFLAAALATFFAGFSAIDLVAYGATVMLVIGASLGASYVPARRILRVDPMISLRQS